MNFVLKMAWVYQRAKPRTFWQILLKSIFGLAIYSIQTPLGRLQKHGGTEAISKLFLFIGNPESRVITNTVSPQRNLLYLGWTKCPCNQNHFSSLKFWSKSWYFHPGVDAYEYILGSIKVNLPRQLCWPPHSSWKIPSTKYDTRVPGCRFTRQPIWCQNHFICWSLSSKILQSYSRQE